MSEVTGTVYTETVVFSPPEAYVNDVPYQLAIVELEDGTKTTGAHRRRARLRLATACTFVEIRNDVPYFQKQ